MNQRGRAHSGSRRDSLCCLCLSYDNTFTYCYFLQVFCPNGISPMGKSGCLPRGKQAATVTLPYDACWVFYCFHNPPNSDMDYEIFNVRIDVNACDCTQGCMDTVREPALKVDSGRKIPCCTRESNLHRQHASLMLYQLSYIPTHLNY